jgi:hypothetical protein
MTVLWDVAACSQGDRLDDGSSKLLWNIGKYLPDYTAQHPRRQPSSYSSLREPGDKLSTARSHCTVSTVAVHQHRHRKYLKHYKVEWRRAEIKRVTKLRAEHLVSIPGRGKNFSLLRRSVSDPSSFPERTGSSLPVGKTAGAWSWQLISN